MKVIVTGGAGFIGSNTVIRLVEKGYTVFVVDNLHTGSRRNLREVSDQIFFYTAEAGDVLTLFSSPDLPKIDAMIHLGIPSSSPMYKDHPFLVAKAIKDAISILEFAKKHKIKVVIASTSSIYNYLPLPWREDMQPIPFDFYTEARIAIERIAKVYSLLHNIPVVILRYFSVYGPREEFKGRYANVITQMIWAALKGETFTIFGDGSQTRDFIYIDDVVEANLKALEFDESRYEVFNIGFGKNYSFNQVAKLVSDMASKHGKQLKIRYTENPIKNYVHDTLADITKAQKVLKWKPKVPLREGIEKTWKYYMLRM